MQKILIFLLLFVNIFIYSFNSFIYRIMPEKVYAGQMISIYGKWAESINEVSLMFNNIKIENSSFNILYFSNERIDFLLTEFYGKTNIYLNSKGTSSSRIINVNSLAPIKYFNKNRYKIKYIVKIDFSEIISLGSGIIYLYIPQPILSDIILSKTDLQISRQPDYIQENGIYIYVIDIKKEKKFVLEQIYEIKTQFKQIELTDDIIPFEYDMSLEFYKFYTKENEFVKPNSALIKKVANQIVGEEKNNIKRLKLIYDWVKKRMIHQYPPESREIEYILTNFKGDCFSDTILFASLARSIGIPIRLNSGHIFYPVWKVAGGHFWQEAFISGIGWIPLDVSLGHAPEFMKNQKFPTTTEFYYGGVDGLRIDFCRGRISIMKPDENNILKEETYLESMQYPYILTGDNKLIPTIKTNTYIIE